MPIDVTCNHCGHTRTISRDELQSGRWRDTACPVCIPRDDDDRETDNDMSETDEAA